MLIKPIAADELGGLAAALRELYRDCFSEPPWNESALQIDGFPKVLAHQLAQPGMFGFAAVDDQLLGVVYGRISPPEQPADDFHRSLASQISAELYRELLAPAVVVNELMVHPMARGRGVGRTLLDRFVADHPSAWLVTHPQAPARKLYESAGWRGRGEFVNYRGDPRVLYTLVTQDAQVAASIC
jgi:ribosomal protein S18 acetylase RimI-like enzyme